MIVISTLCRLKNIKIIKAKNMLCYSYLHFRGEIKG